jgi:hypothetical protein
MNKVDFFKDIKTTIPQATVKGVSFYLDRIKNGSSKKTVESLRIETAKEKKAIIKSTLPVVCFAGTFTKRGKTSLKKGSGLLILDFDHVDIESTIEKLKSIKECFSCWVSPSGDGVKALIRIQTVSSDDEYKFIYRDFCASNSIDCDTSGSDISRACYESYDENIYINDNADIYIPKELPISKENVDLGCQTNIPLTDTNEIANKLIKWFNNKFDNKSRNSSLYKLAIAFNDFGVDSSTASRYLLKFEQKDFNSKEIESLINSAYKNTGNFGTRQFENVAIKKKLHGHVLSGRKKEDIKKEFPNIKNIDIEIELIQISINIEKFWESNNKGDLEINPFLLKKFIESLGYFKYYPNGNQKTFIFIKKEDKFIDMVSEFQIKDHILDILENKGEIDAFNLLADKTRVFANNYLSMLATAEISIEKDTDKYALLYYRNVVLKVEKDTVTQIEYNTLNGFVWKNSVIDRDYIDVDHHTSQFRSFLWFCGGQKTDKYNTLKSIIGYLLHSYKSSATNKAIILNDMTISDTPNGGSGKGLITNALGYMKKVSIIDGKTFDFAKSFLFQTVNTDTQIIAFDDVRNNFEFEKLFSIITEGITIEYKGKDAIKIPSKDSPKILISTNYTIKSDGGSFERRMFEIEMSDFFNSNNSPLDHFGNMLYDDWDEKEWTYFDKFMINCLQYFLENGLIKSKSINLKERKFINATSMEFHEFTIKEKQIIHNQRINKQELTTTYNYHFSDAKYSVSTRTLQKFIRKYAEFIGANYSDGNQNGMRWFSIEDGKDEVIDLMPF